MDSFVEDPSEKNKKTEQEAAPHETHNSSALHLEFYQI